MPLITIGDTALHYERDGTGPPLILAAGLGGLGRYWRAQVDAFRDDFDTITFDHRGVGASAPAPPPYSISGLARDVIGLMDGLDIEKAIYVGHSTGGAMGQWLAANHGERFSAMVLGATWRHADARFRAVFEGRREILLRLGAEAYLRHSLPWLYPPDWFEENEDRLAAIVADGAGILPPAEILAARLAALVASDHADSSLDHVTLPVLVLMAEDDGLIPPYAVSAVAEAIPSARLRRFAWGGHHFPQTRSGSFNRAVRRFLQDPGAPEKTGKPTSERRPR